MNTTDDWPRTRVEAADSSLESGRKPGRPSDLVRLALAFAAGGILAIAIIVLLGLGQRNGSAGNPALVTADNAAENVTPAEQQQQQPAISAANVEAERPFGLPVTRDDWVITKDYAAHGGLKPHPENNQGAIDVGIWHDRNAFGTDVIATHSGTIKLLRDDPTYGNLVYVIGERWSTTYGHLQDFTVKEGDVVKRGQAIGHMGSTGDSSGPHVDYQVWERGVNLNPLDYCNCSGTTGPAAHD